MSLDIWTISFIPQVYSLFIIFIILSVYKSSLFLFYYRIAWVFTYFIILNERTFSAGNYLFFANRFFWCLWINWNFWFSYFYYFLLLYFVKSSESSLICNKSWLMRKDWIHWVPYISFFNFTNNLWQRRVLRGVFDINTKD